MNIVLPWLKELMTLASKSAQPVARSAPCDALAEREEGISHRAAEAGRGQLGERRRQIVDAAYDLLAEGGLEGLTIRAVLKRTGLARRAFYELFVGKDDLVLGVFEQTIRLGASHYGELAKGLPDPMERLKLIVTCLVLGRSTLEGPDGYHSDRRAAALSREHMRLAESRPDDLQAALSPLIILIARQLSDGMDAGSVRTCDVPRLAALVYNLVSTTVQTELLAHETAEPDQARRAELASDIWEFCRRAIAA